jgi:hypothetical protein
MGRRRIAPVKVTNPKGLSLGGSAFLNNHSPQRESDFLLRPAPNQFSGSFKNPSQKYV